MQPINDLITHTRLTWRLLRDPRVAVPLKLIPAAIVVYIISPLDLLPFIPIDDIAVLVFGLRAFQALVPDYIVYEHRAALGMSHEQT
jgi:uncharacterized membrane protein YkvA (DUF1232 family)